MPLPRDNVIPFTVIQGSKPAPAPVAPEPEDPATVKFKAEVRETLTGALAMCDDWTEVLIIFRSEVSGVDTCYSTLTDEERHILISHATFKEIHS